MTPRKTKRKAKAKKWTEMWQCVCGHRQIKNEHKGAAELEKNHECRKCKRPYRSDDGSNYNGCAQWEYV